MKKLFIPILILSLIFSFSSCITSLNPIVTYHNIQKFDAAVGQWKSGNTLIKIEPYRNSAFQRDMMRAFGKDEKKAQNRPLDELKFENSIYLVSYIENDVQHGAALSFTKINGNWMAQFAPLYAVEDVNKNLNSKRSVLGDTDAEILWEYTKGHAYSFAKVTYINGALSFTPVDSEYLSLMMDEGRISISFEKVDLFSRKMITASTENLKVFFEKYGNDDRLFNKKNTIFLKKS